MARYLNIYPQKNVVIQKAYNTEFSDWIFEYEYIATIETDEGGLKQVPVMFSDEIEKTTADDCLKECADVNIRILMHEDCPARDSLIKEKITEWVCNEGCVSGSEIAEAICAVVSLLVRHGMWKQEYGKCIDVKKIKEEWGDE